MCEMCAANTGGNWSTARNYQRWNNNDDDNNNNNNNNGGCESVWSVATRGPLCSLCSHHQRSPSRLSCSMSLLRHAALFTLYVTATIYDFSYCDIEPVIARHMSHEVDDFVRRLQRFESGEERGWLLSLVVPWLDLDETLFTDEETFSQLPSFDSNARKYGGKFKYLTDLVMMLQLVYHTLALMNDLFGTLQTNPGRRGVLQRARDWMMNSMAFPLSLFVPIMFWSLYAYDRDVIFPKSLDAIIPPWLNHVMHTFLLPINIAEKCLTYHHYDQSPLSDIISMSVFTSGYILWILWIAHQSGVWVYPFLALMTNVWRAAFIAFSVVILLPFYWLGRSLTFTVWGVQGDTATAQASSDKRGKKAK